jgi:hypothetical protein
VARPSRSDRLPYRTGLEDLARIFTAWHVVQTAVADHTESGAVRSAFVHLMRGLRLGDLVRGLVPDRLVEVVAVESLGIPWSLDRVRGDPTHEVTVRVDGRYRRVPVHGWLLVEVLVPPPECCEPDTPGIQGATDS